MSQYKEELSNVHAPADLILRTKQAVAIEEAKMAKEENTTAKEAVEEKVISFAEQKKVAKKKRNITGFVAAAAVICCATFIGITMQTSDTNVNKLASQSGTPAAQELQVGNTTVSLVPCEEMPEAFAQAEVKTSEAMTYRAIPLDEGGYSVYIEYNNQKYVVDLNTANVDLYIPTILEQLQQ